MERDFRYLRDKHTDAGAREIFEKICTELLQSMYFEDAHRIKVVQGDGGIDILVGDFTMPIDNYQCKYFIDGVGESQKSQIRDSFNSAIGSPDYKMKKWTLCLPCELGIDAFNWWSGWKSKMEKLHGVPIALFEGSFLITKLKQVNLYDSLFDNDILIQLNEILEYLTAEKRRISEEILIWMNEIEELDYDDMIFVKKLENAKIREIEGCKHDFFNAEFAEQALRSKGNENDLIVLNNLKLKIHSFWQTQYRNYKHETDGNDLLTRVYMRIEDADTTTLETNLSEINLLAKKGILHQWADECNIGWLSDYEQKLKEYLAERGNLMLNNMSFTDYINDSIRILIIANALKDKKSVKLTDYKIKLLDYYLKFPLTMFGNIAFDSDVGENFDEYYSFFHWKPDLIRYRRSINYLIAKGFIVKQFENSSIYFTITEEGIDVVNKLNSSYKIRLVELSDIIAKEVVKLSDSKIEEDIRKKSNIFSRKYKGV